MYSIDTCPSHSCHYFYYCHYIVTTVTHITFVNTVTAVTAVTTSVLSWEGLQLAGVEGSSLGPAQAMEEQMVVAIFEVC